MIHARSLKFKFIVLTALLLALPTVISLAQDAPQPPAAKKIRKELTIHGQTRIDEYYWLNERDNPKVLDYLKAENAYTDAVMKPTEPLQENLYNEMIARVQQTDMSVPYFENGYWYYTRYETGKDYPVYCRKAKTQKAKEEILLDGNKMAGGTSYFNIGDRAISPDNKVMAYGVDTLSRRQYKIYFKNLKTGKNYPEEITMTAGFAIWANDNKTVFYPAIDESLRLFKIFRHTLGTPVSADVEIYHEADPTFELSLEQSRDKKFIFLVSGSTLTTEYRYLDASQPLSEFVVFQPRTRGLEYSVDHLGDTFTVLTNDRARNFRLMKAEAGRTGRDDWREIIPHRDDVLLEGFDLFADYLVLNERKGGLPQIRVIPKGEKEGYCLEFPDKAYVAYSTPTPEPATALLRYGYNSMTTPATVYEFDMKTRQQTVLKRQEVAGYRPEDYATERLLAPAYDGALVPISLVYRKGARDLGPAPLLIYGYGSYGASTDPGFNPWRISLLNRGFIVAAAHIRGGSEMGRAWYEDGKLFKKMNTFTDFISCAEYLVRHGYTAPDKLFAQGASAGGLLMGAVVNLRSDLFKGVLAGVPFVDVVTTMLDASIPLTTSEYDEWGNPNDPAAYEYMMTYSPYDNVRPKSYPAMLVTTGLHDSQVQYFEPAKYVARLRATKTDDHPLILKTNMDAGHGGSSGRFRRLRETAYQYAFILDLARIKD
ncbi:MAG: S9 family peptidase [Candidatus Aminicenantales bacterium]